MLSFVVVSGEQQDKVHAFANQAELDALPFLNFTPSLTTRWRTQRGEHFIEIVVWHNGDAALVRSDRDFSLFTGWSSDYRGTELGEFLSIDLDETGNGLIRRNKSGIYGLYSSQSADKNCHILTDMSSICAWAAQGTKTLQLNRQFMAAAIAVGWPMFDAAFLDAVRIIKPGEEPVFKSGRVFIPDDDRRDRWWSDELHAEYERDQGAFWDARTAELSFMAGEFFGPDGSPKLPSFALSGGKDSRLLLAALLQYPRFKEVLIRTTGSPYGGDVLAATEICSHYGLRHQVTDTVFSEIDLEKAIPEHLFVTQGRVPPTALNRLSRHSPRGLTLHGHELGMRDPFSFPEGETSLESLSSRIFAEFADFDRAGILTADAHHWVKQRASDDFRTTYATSARPENAPWRFYIENRILHYVTQVKASGELSSSVPYPLMTDHLGSAFYVIGRQARLEERAHYEMMRRLEPWLVYECPLNSQRWPVMLRLKESEHHFALPYPSFASKRAPANGVYAAIDQNRNAYRDFVLSNIEKLADIVDRKRVEAAFARASWNQHELGSLLYLVSFLGALGRDWTALSPRSEAASPYPAVIHSTKPATATASGDGPVAEAYRNAVPEAVIGISRHDQAKIMLSTAYEFHKSGKDAEAIELFVAASVLGHPQGHFHLARSYQSGTYLKQDYGLALRHFRAALSKGMLGAAASIGDMYLNGQGIPRNVEEAIRFYRIAAELGDPWTPMKLAKAFEQAERREEADWPAAYRAMSEAGLTRSNAYAAYACWDMITSGKVNGTDEEARSLLEAAARLGNKDAAKALEASNATGD